MCLVALGAASCGPASQGDSGNGSTSDGSGTVADGPTGSTTAVADSTGAEWEAPLARGGITVDWVQANQGVGVTIGADGGEVGGQDRAAPLLQNRITLFRAFWTVPDDWVPRDIEGRLTISWPDGTEESYSDTKLVEDDAFEGDLGRSFYWGLMADQTVPGIKYRVELYEVTADYDDEPVGGTPPTLPVEDGAVAFVGIENGYQVLKTVVVPFIYDDGAGCSTTPDTSPDTMQLYQDLMYMQNPIERLDFELHEPIMWDEPLEGFYQLNQFMAGLRFEEGAPPETYYYGLVDVCDGGLGGAGGQAIDIPTDPVNPDAASSRVSSGLSLGPDWSAETFVHEVGHSQGRRHVACDGEGGPDPSYPHKGGDVGEWGFGVVDFQLRHPTFYKDYMTYCHPTWVGTWGWNKVYSVIAGLSEWDADAPGAGDGAVAPEGSTALAHGTDPYSGSMLLGTVSADGVEHWITVPGALTHEPSDDVRIRFSAGDAVIAESPAYVHEAQDGAGVTLMVPLPEGWSAVDQITRLDGTLRSATPRTAVREHHRSRLIRK